MKWVKNDGVDLKTDLKIGKIALETWKYFSAYQHFTSV